MITQSAGIVDLTDVSLFVRGEHHQVFDRLRAHQDNLHWNPVDVGGFWALTRHSEVAAAYADHVGFSSSGGAMLGGSFRNEADTAVGHMLVASDPPRHRLLRQQMHALFAPPMVQRATAQIRTLVHRAVDKLLADGGGDFADDIAVELPAGALMAMFDVGYTDAHRLVQLTRSMIGFRDDRYGKPGVEERAHLASIQGEIFDYFQDLTDSRRNGGRGDDAVSMLQNSMINGRRMSDEDLLYNCMNVAVGGNETSSYSACHGLEALMNHPAEYGRFLSHGRTTESFLDEVLRWSSTNAYVQRIATRRHEIRGSVIQPGDAVTLWNVSANRDESVFAEPHRFDIERSPNRHLTFGSGIHRCIGAPVGRAELQIVFDHLAERGIRLVQDGPSTPLSSNFILGMTRLRVKVEDASR